jgi:spore maturation protein SpmA
MAKQPSLEGDPDSRKIDNRPSLMNNIWFFLLGCAVLVAALGGRMAAVTDASFEAAKSAVVLAIGLVGAMALWLGLVRVAEKGGLLRLLARAIRPIMTRLFPDVPPDDPAMSSMILNMAANAMGLGNAATPLGIKAMMALNRLNRHPGEATDAMCLFLAINTSSVTLLPLGVIGVRAAAGAADPAAILVPTLGATLCSTLVAVIAAKGMKRMRVSATGAAQPTALEASNADNEDDMRAIPAPCDGPVSAARWRRVLAVGVPLAFFSAMAWHGLTGDIEPRQFSAWLVPGLMLGLVCYGFGRGLPVYEVAVEGAKEGFEVAVRLIPFLVMILVAVGMFRASGAFDLLTEILSPLTDLLRIPVEVLPVALLRPLSGSGAFGLMSEITANAPDSFAALLAGTIQGSTETTFYVLAVYFGAVGVRKARYAVAAALMADLAGFLAAVLLCHCLYPA